MAPSAAPPASKKRRWPWLVVAALLFGAGAWLMAGSEEVKTDKSSKISLPRSMTHEERLRNDTRRTMAPLPVAAPAQSPDSPTFEPPAASKPRDPMLAAMPPDVKKMAVVVEANAIRHSELGDLMVECIFTGEANALQQVKDSGFDPLESLDRFAVADEAVMLTGDFSKADIPRMMNTHHTGQFGANSELFSRERPNGGSGEHMGLWKGQVLVVADDLAEVTAVLDRLDGKGDPAAKGVLTDADAYGEMYGVVKPQALADDLAEKNPVLAKLIEQAASSIRIHADVSHDVGLVADVQGSDPTKTQDLRKAIGTALTLAKLQAEANGNKNVAEVLGFAKVAQARSDSANFNLEAGIPFEFLEARLRKCVDDKKKKIAEKEVQVP